MTIDSLEKPRSGRPPLLVLCNCCACGHKYLIYEMGEFWCRACGSAAATPIARELPKDGWRIFNRGSVTPV